MCCKLCEHHLKCNCLVVVRLHPAAQALIPAPHYHLCGRAGRACDFNCKLCGRLIREISYLPTNHTLYGCCHRCAEYARCDFVERHRKSAVSEPVEAQSVLQAPAAETRAEPAGPAVAAQGTDRLRVLIADDNAAFLESAVEFLAHDPGLEIFGASDGRQALHVMNRFHPTLAVLDIVMPGVSGFDVCSSIRKSAGAEQVRVLILTAYASQSMAEQAKSCGADLCLAKPIQLNDLKNRILSLAHPLASSGAPGSPAAGPPAIAD